MQSEEATENNNKKNISIGVQKMSNGAISHGNGAIRERLNNKLQKSKEKANKEEMKRAKKGQRRKNDTGRDPSKLACRKWAMVNYAI